MTEALYTVDAYLALVWFWLVLNAVFAGGDPIAALVSLLRLREGSSLERRYAKKQLPHSFPMRLPLVKIQLGTHFGSSRVPAELIHFFS